MSLFGFSNSEDMNAMRTLLLRLLVVGLILAPALARAQTWPQKTVRFIVPLPPGSGMDLSARLVAERLTERWGQPVVVENRQGADGIPAVTGFLSARDNHTFLFSFGGIVTFNHLLHERLPYDPKELVPIAPVIDNFLGVSASAVLKVDTLADLVQAAKAQPGKLNWAATPGLPYYVLLALQKSAGIDMVQVAYRDFAPAYQDLNQGRLHVAGTGVPTLVPHHRAGTAKLLFVTNRERSPQAPDVPTAAEAGYPDLTFDGVVRHLRLARHAGGDQSAHRDRYPRDHRRPGLPGARDRRRHRAAAGHAGGIRRGDRGAARQDRGDPSGQRQEARAVNVAPAPTKRLSDGNEDQESSSPREDTLTKFTRRQALATAFLAAPALLATRTQAQTPAQAWPQRPVRFIIPFGPGAGADIGARLIQEKLSTRWGKPVVIDNRPGGDSIIAIQAVLSANDDHTFLWGPSGNFIVHPYLYQEAVLQPGRHSADRELLLARCCRSACRHRWTSATLPTSSSVRARRPASSIRPPLPASPSSHSTTSPRRRG